MVAWAYASAIIFPECGSAEGRNYQWDDQVERHIETHLHPAGRGPMVDAKREIQRGLVDPKAALLPVQAFHQAVLVSMTGGWVSLGY